MTDRLMISNAQDVTFHSEGPRPFFEYCELGLVEATEGRAAAYRVRALREVRHGDGTGPHFHSASFQLLHVLAGRALVNYEGKGPTEVSAGTTIFHPTGVRHDVLEVSSDYDMIIVEMPVKYDTIPVESV
jgi:quercetin dioxygenase-like cupin family protein